MKDSIILCFAILALLVACASNPTIIESQKFTLVQRVIETTPNGQVVIIKDTYEPVVPFNFWDTVYDMAVSVGKKTGGL